MKEIMASLSWPRMPSNVDIPPLLVCLFCFSPSLARQPAAPYHISDEMLTVKEKSARHLKITSEQCFRSVWGLHLWACLWVELPKKNGTCFKCQAWLAFRAYISPYEAYLRRTPQMKHTSVTLHKRGAYAPFTHLVFKKKEEALHNI